MVLGYILSSCRLGGDHERGPQQTCPYGEKRMLCPKCGAENEEHNKFCFRCGTPLIQGEPSASEDSTATVSRKSFPPLWLFMVAGILGLIGCILVGGLAYRHFQPLVGRISSIKEGETEIPLTSPSVVTTQVTTATATGALWAKSPIGTPTPLPTPTSRGLPPTATPSSRRTPRPTPTPAKKFTIYLPIVLKSR